MPRAAKALLAVVGTVLGLALLTYGASFVLNGSDVPRGVSVAGTDVGGQSESEAREDVRRVLGARADGPVRLVADGQTLELDPAAAGLTLDLDATFEEATSAGPLDRVRGMLGATREVDPVTTSDRARLTKAVEALAARFDRALQEGSVRFEGLTPVAVTPESGRALDVEGTVDAVLEQWLTRDSIDAPTDVTEPEVSERAVQDALSTAAPAVGGPVRLTADRTALVLQPADTAAVLTFAVSAGGTLTPAVDGQALRTRLGDRLDAVEDEPADATFEIRAGKPVLVPARVGRTATAAALSKAVVDAVQTPARTAPLALQQQAPELGTAKAQSLGIRERIGTFTTRHPCCAPRVTNIHRIADLVDGTVVLPGETYSLNGAVGERTRAKGFVAAPQIQDGEFVDGVGGGISQFTTTMYNATFFAGLEDVEHTPHSYYISRYPEGREATITFPRPDLKWKNDSPTGVLITTSYTGTSITVTLYGTKRYDEVLSQSSGRTRVTSPTTQTRTAGPDCESQSGGTGFSITITRVMKVDGKEVRRTSASHRYLAQPRIVCVSAPRPAPTAPRTPTPQPSASPAG